MVFRRFGYCCSGAAAFTTVYFTSTSGTLWPLQIIFPSNIT
jgi:hypothetical protein